MGTLVFSNGSRSSTFKPMCEEGHVLDGFTVGIGDHEDVYLIDDKGWLFRMDWSKNGKPDNYQYNGLIAAHTECERCLEKRREQRIYHWRLDFTFGLLRRAWQRPSELLGIEIPSPPERPQHHP